LKRVLIAVKSIIHDLRLIMCVQDKMWCRSTAVKEMIMNIEIIESK
jgi:hypothetical protein